MKYIISRNRGEDETERAHNDPLQRREKTFEEQDDGNGSWHIENLPERLPELVRGCVGVERVEVVVEAYAKHPVEKYSQLRPYDILTCKSYYVEGHLTQILQYI